MYSNRFCSVFAKKCVYTIKDLTHARLAHVLNLVYSNNSNRATIMYRYVVIMQGDSVPMATW